MSETKKLHTSLAMYTLLQLAYHTEVYTDRDYYSLFIDAITTTVRMKRFYHSNYKNEAILS